MRCASRSGAVRQPAQGIFTWWINRWLQRRALSYLGFGGRGLQVRDCLHPADLAALAVQQMRDAAATKTPRIFNVSGGAANAMSLAQLSAWCTDRLGAHQVGSDAGQRAYDVPWVVLDATAALERWQWVPKRAIDTVLAEIAGHAAAHPEWLTMSEG